MEAANHSDIKVENGANMECIEIEIPYDLYQYLRSGDYNTHTICRLCLSLQNNIMYPLISDQDNNGLSEMLKAFTTIEIQPEEGLPFLVCESCKNQVIHCYEFKLKCEKTDFTLKSVLKGEFYPKNGEVLHEPPPVATDTKEHNNDDKIDSNVVKVEPVFEDAQYLENDMTCENDNMNIIQNTAKRKKKTYIKSIPESTVFHEDEPRKKNNKYLKCSFCSKNFQKAKALQAHMKSKHKDIRLSFPCTQCNDSFNSEHDLFVHSALHSKTAWSCNQCHKVFNAKHTLRRHIQRHMQCKRYSCMACDKTFVELYALRRHARVHTGEVVEKKHACDICDKKYSESCLLAAHVSTVHLGERPCACAQCGKHFASPRLLASHRRLHTDDKPFTCRYCDKRFRHKSTRNTHHRTHTGEKPYVCSYCGKTFIQNSNLTLHLRTHTGERPYSCGVCARSFTSGSALKAHERTHTGERPYTCPVCGKSFARMNMKVHMRLHTGERPHRCGACGKTYVTASRLKDHAKVHTGERPYECASCMKNYSSRSHLVKHIKAHQLAKRKAQQRKDPSHQRKETVIVQHIREHKQDDEIVVETGAEEYTESNKGIILEESEVPLEMQGEICINPNVVNFVNNDYASDINLVTVNEGGLSISAAGVLEAATVKLYQVDQSLVQIHSSGGQVTISKITSKMTANF